MRDNFILVSPNIQVNKNAWLDHGDCPHLYYNVSSNLAQEDKNIWHKLLGSNFDDMRRSGCLSVSVDITDPKEMEILKEVLLRYWTKLVMELEIFFKHNIFTSWGKNQPLKKYRGILLKVKAQNEDIEKKHLTELRKYSISDQMELLDVMAQKGVSYFNIKEKKERLEEELHLAEEKWSAIKVPHVDWYKMGESSMAKP
ncbi:hypothetical protein Bca101_067574 [Brassica carinata]